MTKLDQNKQQAFLQAVSELGQLPCILWTSDCFWCSDDTKKHPCKTDPAFLQRLIKECGEDKPGIFFEDDHAAWGIMRTESCYIGIGPVLVNAMDGKYGKQYAGLHGLKDSYVFRILAISELAKYLALCYSHFYGKTIHLEEVAFWGSGAEHFSWESEQDISQYQFMQAEYERSHKSGRDFEEKLMETVRNGDLETIKQLMGGDMPGIVEVGEVAQEERKQIEYLAVSLLTLLTRAAVEGGMRPEAAYDLGDIYLRRLASANLGGNLQTSLVLRAMFEFTEGVQQAKAELSGQSHIEACKAYIEANLLKNIHVGDVAPALGLSRTYLSHLFKREEGITLQQYIQREKCRYAERQLKYTDYSIALIAEYFGFSSPGYFANCFRQWYGVSPGEYRRANFHK